MSFEFLDSLDLMITFSVLLLLFINLLLVKRFGSVVITVIAYLIVQALSFAFVELLRDGGEYLGAYFTRLIWYFGFAFVNLLAVVVIYRGHNALREPYSIASRSTSSILMFFALLQVASFFDRQYGTDALATFYMWAIPVGNVAIFTLLAVSSVLMLLQKKGYSGAKGI